jgi:hypothetical protein
MRTGYYYVILNMLRVWILAYRNYALRRSSHGFHLVNVYVSPLGVGIAHLC